MNEYQKYLIQERAKIDKWQTMFDKGYIVMNFRKGTIEEFFLNSEKYFICPFCLTANPQLKFLLKEKNHYVASCPNCKQNVHFKTLFALMRGTAEDYANFVYGYRLSGFWDKVYPNFETWKKNLHNLGFGFSTEFWNRYKELKGENEDNDSE